MTSRNIIHIQDNYKKEGGWSLNIEKALLNFTRLVFVAHLAIVSD